VLRAGDPLTDGQQRGELVPGPCGVTRLTGPPGEVAAGDQGVWVFGAQYPLLDGQQRGELVPGPSRIPRVPSEAGEVAIGLAALGARVGITGRDQARTEAAGTSGPGLTWCSDRPRLDGPAVPVAVARRAAP